MKEVLDQIELIATIIERHPAMTQDEEFRKQVADGFAELKIMMHERQLAQQANEAKLSQMQSDITRLARNVEDERLIVRLSILEQSFASVAARTTEIEKQNENFKWKIIGAWTTAVVILAGIIINLALKFAK